MDANQMIPEGALLRLEDGIWENYHVLGLYRVLKPFVPSEVADVVLKSDWSANYSYVSVVGLEAKLIFQGYVEKVVERAVFVQHYGWLDTTTCKIEGIEDGR